MRKIIAEYQNGNYRVTLFENGTKIKRTADDVFVADFPDSIDLKITDRCENNCPMCHENSSASGKHADLDHPIVDSFIPGTEVAIGGGNPLLHPDLMPFLKKLKRRCVIANMTVNGSEITKERERLEALTANKLIYGLGVSMHRYDPAIVEFAKGHDNVVLHLINGVFPVEDYDKIMDTGLKILILGYKRFGRGKDHFSAEIADNMAKTEAKFDEIKKGFKVVSFDNLALEQLKVKEKIGEQNFDAIYMGDDGEASMYVDLVKEEFALSSTSTDRYPLKQTLKECFQALPRLKK